MRQNGVDAGSLGRILLEDGRDEALRLFGEAVGDLKVALQNLLLHDSLVIVIEWQSSAQKGVEDDTERPDIDLFSRIPPAGKHLWRGIAGGAAKRVHETVALELARKAKVAKLDIAALVEENVFELEIAVNDALAVYVGDGEAELAKDSASFGLSEHLVLDQVVVELAASAYFADHPDVLLCGDDFVELHDVGMMETTVVVDLASEAGGVGLGYLFDGYASVGETVKAETDFPKSAFADGSLEGIVADNLEFGGGELLAKLLVGRGESGFLVDGRTAALTAMVAIASASAGLTHCGIARRRSAREVVPSVGPSACDFD